MHHFIEILTGDPKNAKNTIPYLLYQYVWDNPSEWKGKVVLLSLTLGPIDHTV